MSKQKKDKPLFENGTITEEAMLAYLGNELTVEEKQQFERLLSEDPFAREALEGLQATQGKAAIAGRIANINKRVRSQTGAKEGGVVKIHWVNYAWAAAILGLLVGIGFFMISYMGQSSKTIAENKVQDSETQITQHPETAAAPADTAAANDTIALTTDVPALGYTTDSAVVSVRPGLSSTTTPAGNANVAGDKTADANGNTVTFNVSKPQPAAGQQITTTTGTNAQTTTKQPVTVKGEVAEADRAKDDVAKKGKEAKTEDLKATEKNVRVGTSGAGSGGAAPGSADPNVTVEEAKKNFNKGNYKESAEQFDAILKREPDNKDALYFGAVSDYINGKTNKSEKSFDKLLNSGTSYVEGSKWYKANILLQKGKKEDAKKILNEISNGSGSYKERASNKLKEIQ